MRKKRCGRKAINADDPALLVLNSMNDFDEGSQVFRVMNEDQLITVRDLWMDVVCHQLMSMRQFLSQ